MRWAALIIVVVSACGFSKSIGGQLGDDGDDAPAPDAAMPKPDAPPQASTRRRVELTFRNANRNEAFDDFAVLVVLNSTRIDYTLCAAGGADLRFFDSDGTTPLPYEIELWDAAGTSYVWVRVPRIDASSNTDRIYMHYGEPTAVDAQDPTGVWSTDYRSVWHLAEDPAAGGADDIRDSTAIGNHGTATAAMTTNDHVAGPIGFGVRLDGSNNGIDATSMTLANYTWSMWMKADALPVTGSGNHQPITNGDSAFNFAWDHNSSGFTAAAAQYDGSNWRGAKASVTWAAGTWYFVVGRYDGQNLCMFVNGSGINSCVSAGTPAAPSHGRLRMGLATSNGSTFRGALDEVRVFDQAQSAMRISAEYANQRADNANPFVVFGVPEILP